MGLELRHGGTVLATVPAEVYPPEPEPVAGQGYHLAFQDDFDALDSNVWVPPPAHGTTFPPGAVSVADSVLTVRADQAAARPYVEVWSLGPQVPTYPRYPQALAWQEGYFEVRARCTNDPWTKLALWFFSLEAKNSFGVGRDCGTLNAEWDMVENGIRGVGPAGYADVNHVSVAHRNTGDACGIPDESRFYSVDGENFNDWHVWGGKWTATEVSTYLDGQLLGTQPVYDTFAQPLAFVISAAPLGDVPGVPKPSVIETQVDWFRVWQLP